MELHREVWSSHPWQCPRKGWRWYSELWAGEKVGIRHTLDSMIWEGFFHLKDCVIPQGISLLSSTSTTEVMSANSQQSGLEKVVRKGQMTGISPSKEKHLRDTSGKDKLGRIHGRVGAAGPF